MLQAKADWYWFFEQETQSIRLNMTDFVFVTACSAKHLLPNATQTQSFSVDDNQVYTEFYAFLEDELKLAEAQCVQIALNSLAHLKFTQFAQPKSWYFETQKQSSNPNAHHNHNHNKEQSIAAQTLVKLQSKLAIGQFLVIESDDEFPVLMLLNKSMALTESKSINQFEVIKVMSNRVVSMHSQKKQQSLNLFRA